MLPWPPGMIGPSSACGQPSKDSKVTSACPPGWTFVISTLFTESFQIWMA
jgi:hypothetical protein